MSIQIAETRPGSSALLKTEVRPSVPRLADGERPCMAIRGVILAVLISLPIWVLVGIAIYLIA